MPSNPAVSSGPLLWCSKPILSTVYEETDPGMESKTSSFSSSVCIKHLVGGFNPKKHSSLGITFPNIWKTCKTWEKCSKPPTSHDLRGSTARGYIPRLQDHYQRLRLRAVPVDGSCIWPCHAFFRYDMQHTIRWITSTYNHRKTIGNWWFYEIWWDLPSGNLLHSELENHYV